MSSPFNSANAPNGVTSPASDCVLVTPSDESDLSAPARAFYASGAGNISVVTASGNTRTIPVGAFQLIPVAITRVRATGTTATGIVVLAG